MMSSCPVSGIRATDVPKASGCPFANRRLASHAPKDVTLTIPEQYRHVILTPQQRELIKASVPALQAKGLDITRTFYGNMLAAHKELNEIFNQANQTHLEQPRALANSVLGYAQNIDDLSPLAPVVELVAHKHASLCIRPEQYQIVGQHLIEAIGAVLGDAVTPELAEAWTAAYWQLAEILMKREDQLYAGSEGWTDWQDFKIAKKVVESKEVTSFYLEPVDESSKPLPSFLPGQFISIQMDVPSLGHKQTRQYSLSDKPSPKYYRISIKREAGNNAINPPGLPGLISNIMHNEKKEGDVVRVSHPYGDFFLDMEAESTSPLVLVSGGVGLTPMTSILNSIETQNSTRPISWIHGARSHAVRPFTKHMTEIGQSRDNVQVTMFTNEPADAEFNGVQQHEGHIDLTKLDNNKTLFLNDPSAQYFVCGPMPFMVSMEKALLERGVEAGRIHMEKFGMGGVPRNINAEKVHIEKHTKAGAPLAN